MAARVLLSVFFLVAATVSAAVVPNSHPPLHITLKNKPTNVMTRIGNAKGYHPEKVIHLNGNLTYWAEYFAAVNLGTPPQYFNLQVDTGSTDLIVYGSDCYGCPPKAAEFDIGKSSTGDTVNCYSDQYTCANQYCDGDNCKFQLDYGGGSGADGFVGTDVFGVGNLRTKGTYSLGSITSVTFPAGQEFEPTSVDGIWGFAFEQLSGWGGSSMFSNLVYDYGFYDGFSLCLGENGGTLTLGADYSNDTRFRWTDITQEIWYSVYIDDIKLNNKTLGISETDLNWNGVIVDSGTTLIIVSDQIMQAIQDRLQAMCSKVNLVGVCGVPYSQSLFNSSCFKMTTAQVNQFPSVTITLDGAGDLTIYPIDYLWQGAGIPDYYCLGIQVIDSSYDLPVILGDVFMQRFHVAFDRNAGKVGFGPLSSCPKQ